MIKSISITNFKNIGEQTLKLDNLKDVNYLVGPNNSGKSSILYAALCFDRHGRVAHFFKDGGGVVFETDGGQTYTINQLDSRDGKKPGYISSNWFSPEYNSNNPSNVFTDAKPFPYVQCDEVVPSNKIYYQFFSEKLEYISKHVGLEAKDLCIKTDGGDVLSPGVSRLFLKDSAIKMSSVADGIKQIISLMRSLENTFEHYGATDGSFKKPSHVIFCIDEPETYLHPGLQKVIPLIMQSAVDRLKNFGIHGVYFIVATHSPFIISAAAEFEAQKVYLIKDGQTMGLRGDVGSGIGINGYSGSHALGVASKMLGAGVEDVSGPSSSIEDLNIIYCEGGSKATKDSIYYSIIFPESGGSTNIFISCKSAKDVIDSYFRSSESISYILGNKGNVNVCAIIDRSCSFGNGIKTGYGNDDWIKTDETKIIFSDEDLDRFYEWHKETNIKVLTRKEIEDYLIDEEILKKYDSGLFEQYIEELNRFFKDFQNMAKDEFCKQCPNYRKEVSRIEHGFEGFKRSLAKNVTSETAAYRKLYEDIFG